LDAPGLKNAEKRQPGPSGRIRGFFLRPLLTQKRKLL
jgi:hypothetical protein